MACILETNKGLFTHKRTDSDGYQHDVFIAWDELSTIGINQENYGKEVDDEYDVTWDSDLDNPCTWDFSWEKIDMYLNDGRLNSIKIPFGTFTFDKNSTVSNISKIEELVK